MFVNILLVAYILIVIVYGLIKKVNCFEAFTNGIKEGTVTVLNMYSYFLGFVLLVSLIESCGIINDLENLFRNLGFSPLIIIQALMRPFSSGSSYALMLEIYQTEGVDSFSGVLATFIHTVSDASIYIIVFFSAAAGIKKYGRALWIGVLINIIGFVISYFLTLLIV
ncbi:MAG: hypothetical protein ACOX43_00755 [Bacilli bacterium]